MKYRREIDGLRALAIVPVIMYHAGFQAFGGGFVGVDVFFVISGYLITSLIVAERQAGTFSLLDFYERRARRILPALVVVVLACIPFAWQLLTPRAMKDFSESVVAVSTFSSNIFFLRKSGYFDISSELQPLIHTWSLAVEEQYYAIFPLYVLVVWRFGTKRLTQLTATAAVASFALMFALHSTKSAAAFFLLPTRAWELLTGALIALNRHWIAHRTRPLLCEAGAAGGFGLICVAIFAFDKTTPFPSAYTLVPILGATLIIACATPATLVGRLLASPPLVGCGLISYSAYLWHQPLFAFLRHTNYADGAIVYLALTGASFALAYATWLFVEIPFRNKRVVSRHAIGTSAASLSLGLIAFGVVGHTTDGYELRLTDAQRNIIAYDRYDHDKLYRAGKCFLGPDQDASSYAPECSAPNPAGATIVWGDSHAAALSSGVRTLEPDTSQYTASGCPPVIGLDISWRRKCRSINDFVYTKVREVQPKRLLLHANWELYAREKAIDRLASTIVQIQQASPNTQIYLIGPVPQWPVSLPDYMIKHDVPLAEGVYAPPLQLAGERVIDHSLGEIARVRNVRFVSAIDALCRNEQCLAAANDGLREMPTAWDYGHLTQAGSLVLARRVLAAASL
jgi:peptidoglycan/LPS O-acetylase OafA/YrhL